MNAPNQTRERVIWLNGEFFPESRARISPLDRGLLFGDGLFETILAREGKPLYLDCHLKRLHESARYLKIPWDRGLDWKNILERLLHENRLETGLARGKILLTRGCAPGLGLPHADTPTRMVLAENYLPPSQGAYAHGWDLFIPPRTFAPPLAAHKSLNYLYYMFTKQQAIDNGAHEALIIDKDGMVAETCAGTLLAFDSDGWFTPASEWQLPGTAFQQVERLLRIEGYIVRRRPVTVQSLKSARWVWAANSLMGIMPVRSIDGEPIASLNNNLAASLRNRLLLG
ncbi:MAG: aminotransferase class IV [Desulfatibacillum sp.]|nr:aminotransferase class IV [Desulfatibacillum sp.]